MSNKKSILVTGGAGFVASNLIKILLDKTKFNIISLDNYSSGFKKNHIKNKRIKYVKGETKNINSLIKNPKNIHSVFHFGEFARIYQSFINMNECIAIPTETVYGLAGNAYSDHACRKIFKLKKILLKKKLKKKL